MTNYSEIDLVFSTAAIKYFSDFLPGFVNFEPTLCLIKGKPTDKKCDNYCNYGAYDPEKSTTYRARA